MAFEHCHFKTRWIYRCSNTLEENSVHSRQITVLGLLIFTWDRHHQKLMWPPISQNIWNWCCEPAALIAVAILCISEQFIFLYFQLYLKQCIVLPMDHLVLLPVENSLILLFTCKGVGLNLAQELVTKVSSFRQLSRALSEMRSANLSQKTQIYHSGHWHYKYSR